MTLSFVLGYLLPRDLGLIYVPLALASFAQPIYVYFFLSITKHLDIN